MKPRFGGQAFWLLLTDVLRGGIKTLFFWLSARLSLGTQLGLASSPTRGKKHLELVTGMKRCQHHTREKDNPTALPLTPPSWY